TKEKPAKDLGNIAKKLEPGDVVHVAEGTYLGRAKAGSTTLFVPVSIIGGYSDDFSKRDPWGAHRTILSGQNPSKNYTSDPTLFIDLMKYQGPNHPIVVDGLIVDLGGRNHYKSEAQAKLMPKASPKTGMNPSPSLGALVVRVSKSEKFDRGPRWDITVRNNIIINAYTNQGALSVSAFKGSKVKIHNNLVAQHSGHGIFVGSKFAGSADFPQFDVAHNTVVFSWDSGFSQGFNIGFDRSTTAVVRNNVFAFADLYAIWNGYKSEGITLVDNLITGGRKGDLLEFDTVIAVEDLEDEAEYLGEDTEDNVSEKIALPVSKDFATVYGSRVVVDREKLEADIQATNSDANALRSMLGLPLRAGSVSWPKIEVFINRLSVDDAVALAR
ncbi:MAG: right-handed parallel beta-helix repeat-containing protein, partial [Myxococcota bacterium]